MTGTSSGRWREVGCSHRDFHYVTYAGEPIKRFSADGTCVEKRCPDCREWKPYTNEHFFWNKARGSFQSQCKACQRAYCHANKARRAQLKRASRARSKGRYEEELSSGPDARVVPVHRG